jgi:PAS domain S-box-containing protein
MIAESRTEYELQACILDSQPVGILAFDQQSKVISWNAALEKITGLKQARVIGKILFEVLSFTSFTDTQLKKTLEGDVVEGIAGVGDSQFEITASPVINAAKKIVGGTILFGEPVYGSFQLSQMSKNGFKAVVEKSPLSTLIFNLDGSIFYSNNAYRNLWGIADNDLKYVNERYNIFKDTQLERVNVMSYVHQAFEGKTVMNVPVFKYQLSSKTIKRKINKSRVFWFKGYLYPVFDKQEQLEYVVLNFVDLTSQTKAENARRLSEERLQLALEGGNLGTWDWDLKNNKLTYSKHWAEMLGFSLEEVHKIKWENLVHPEDLAWVNQRLMDCVKGNVLYYEAEYRVRTKKGPFKWILDRGKVVDWAEGDKRVALRAAGTHLDITKRKESERILKESEDKYRKLADNAPIGITIIAENTIVYANEELVRMAGAQEKEQLLGKPNADFIPPRKLAAVRERQQLVEAGVMAPNYETVLKKVNGEEFEVQIISIPMTYHGRPAMQSLIQDISLAKKSERNLLRNQQLLTQLFDNSPLGIVMLDSNFDVVQINKGFKEIFGYSNHDLIGEHLNDIIVPDDLMGEAEELNKSAREGRIDYFESHRLNKDRERIPVVIYALPIVDNGEYIGIYGIYIDIHERVGVEEELKVRNMELDHFVYKVSHDLRAPLASILGLINLSKLEDDRETQEYYVELMRVQVEKLDQFIHDILSHSKNLNLDVVTSEINFEEIIETCFSDLAYLDAASDINKTVNVSGAIFYSDKWRISEIFRNLISNAIKYSNPESTNKIVNISVAVDRKECRVIIEDNGLGIPEEYLPKIFDMFYRGTDISDGSGIGLYIVKNAIEKLEGKMDIKSESNVGTTFTITLPVQIVI